jgi:microcystin-dependent protein
VGTDTITGVVTQVEIAIDEKGVRITPYVGTPGTGPDDPDDVVRRQIEAIESRVQNVEVNTIPGGSITGGLLAAGSVTRAALGANGLPIGMTMWSASPSIPAGWLYCDGSAVSRTTYALLFASIGTYWGAGNGSTTFNVPDMRGKVALGNGAAGHDLGETGGTETYDLSHAHDIKHTHTGSTSASTDANNTIQSGTGASTRPTGHVHPYTTPAMPDTNSANGLTTPMTIMPPHAVGLWLIHSGV